MVPQAPHKVLSTDILILGAGGAGLFAALHAHKALDVVGFGLVILVLALQWFHRPAIRTS